MTCTWDLSCTTLIFCAPQGFSPILRENLPPPAELEPATHGLGIRGMRASGGLRRFSAHGTRQSGAKRGCRRPRRSTSRSPSSDGTARFWRRSIRYETNCGPQSGRSPAVRSASRGLKTQSCEAPGHWGHTTPSRPEWRTSSSGTGRSMVTGCVLGIQWIRKPKH